MIAPTDSVAIIVRKSAMGTSVVFCIGYGMAMDHYEERIKTFDGIRPIDGRALVYEYDALSSFPNWVRCYIRSVDRLGAFTERLRDVHKEVQALPLPGSTSK